MRLMRPAAAALFHCDSWALQSKHDV